MSYQRSCPVDPPGEARKINAVVNRIETVSSTFNGPNVWGHLVELIGPDTAGKSKR